jgi:hypothetical protein
VFIFYLLFDFSEIDEILRLQFSSKMVLVSSPESVIQGVNCRPGASRDRPGGNKKGGPLSANPPGFVVLVCRRCQFQASRRLGGGQDPQSSGPGNRLRPAVGALMLTLHSRFQSVPYVFPFRGGHTTYTLPDLAPIRLVHIFPSDITFRNFKVEDHMLNLGGDRCAAIPDGD